MLENKRLGKEEIYQDGFYHSKKFKTSCIQLLNQLQILNSTMRLQVIPIFPSSSFVLHQPSLYTNLLSQPISIPPPKILPTIHPPTQSQLYGTLHPPIPTNSPNLRHPASFSSQLPIYPSCSRTLKRNTNEEILKGAGCLKCTARYNVHRIRHVVYCLIITFPSNALNSPHPPVPPIQSYTPFSISSQLCNLHHLHTHSRAQKKNPSPPRCASLPWRAELRSPPHHMPIFCAIHRCLSCSVR
jgi:hypothetical protein